MARPAFGRRGPPSASAPVGAETALPIIVRTALALALATPLMALGGWLPDAIFPHVVGKALYFRLWTEIAFAAWVLLIIRYPAYRLPRSWLLIALLVYLGVALAASFAGVSLARSLWSNYERMQGWIGLAHYTAFALMAASILRSSRHWEAALNLNLLVGLLVGLLGLYETTFGTDERVGGTFGNPSFLASYALVNSLIAGGFLARSLAAAAGPDHDDKAVLTESLMRSFWVMVICLDLLMLAQSGTRGAAARACGGNFLYPYGRCPVAWTTRPESSMYSAGLWCARAVRWNAGAAEQSYCGGRGTDEPHRSAAGRTQPTGLRGGEQAWRHPVRTGRFF